MVAILREVGDSFVDALRSPSDDAPGIDVARARVQHAEYAATLRRLGVPTLVLPADERFPDGVFVEDPVLVLDEVAVVLRMGAPSRRGEAAAVAEAVSPYRRLLDLPGSGTIEGGDVLRVGRDLFVGRSTRTTDEGIDELRRVAAPLGYRVSGVELRDCLHLKSACTHLGRHLLLDPERVDGDALGNLPRIELPPGEPGGANTLALAGHVLVPASAPETAEVLRSAGYDPLPVEVSEMEKADAGLTCMSVRTWAGSPGDALPSRSTAGSL